MCTPSHRGSGPPPPAKARLGFSSLGKGQLGPGMMMEAGLLPRAVPLSIGWASVGPGVLAYQLCKSLFQ